ncbi:MAG: FlgD immunoglobulin-like domain containing protein [Candidatus Coatesbacteria bacterium]
MITAAAILLTGLAALAGASYDITNTAYVNCRNSAGVAQPPVSSSTSFTVTDGTIVVPPPPLPANAVVVSIFDTSGRLIRTLAVEATDEGVTLRSVGDGSGHASLAAGAGVAIVLSDGTRILWDGRDGSGIPVPNGLYTVRLSDVRPDGREVVSTATVAVTRPYERVIETAVMVPNPADEVAWISFRLADATGTVDVRIYNVAGELVAKGSAPGTARSYRWDLRNRSGTRVTPGLYVVVLEATDSTGVRKDRAIMKLAVERGR